MKTLLKKLISKIGNWMLISIWFTLGIWIIGLVYATYTWTTQTPVWAWSGLTAQAWNDMINNMWYLKENVETKLASNWNGSALTWLTKIQVWLWNVDNTSDLNKPISTAVQAALNLKANTTSTCIKWSALYWKTDQTCANCISCNPVVLSASTSCTTTSVACSRYTTCTFLWYLCQ